MMLKTVRGLENVDTDDLLIKDNGRTRGHVYKLQNTRSLHSQEI